MTDPATEQKTSEELTRLLQHLRRLKDEIEKYRSLLSPDELDRLMTEPKK